MLISCIPVGSLICKAILTLLGMLQWWGETLQVETSRDEAKASNGGGGKGFACTGLSSVPKGRRQVGEGARLELCWVSCAGGWAAMGVGSTSSLAVSEDSRFQSHFLPQL